MERKYPLKKYQIWIGNYSLGQGFPDPTKPKMLSEIEAPTFKVACVIFELRSSLENIENLIKTDQWVDHQSCHWFYDFEQNRNSWTGKYYETQKEAQESFK